MIAIRPELPQTSPITFSLNVMRRSLFAISALFAASVMLASSFAFASDPIPGVDVILKNKATGATLTTRTDATGTFRIGLDEGQYSIIVPFEACDHAINTKGTGSSGRSYTAGHFSLEIDNVDGIAVADLDGDAAPDQVKGPRDIATGQASGKRMHKPFTITKEWTASAPGARVTVTGKRHEFTGHVTLMK